MCMSEKQKAEREPLSTRVPRETKAQLAWLRRQTGYTQTMCLVMAIREFYRMERKRVEEQR